MSNHLPPVQHEDVTDLQEVRSARQEIESFLEDVKAAAEPEWEQVAVPAWNNRKVWVRGLTLTERVRIRRDGYEPAKSKDGEIFYKETGELEPLLLGLTVYVEVGGRKQRLFHNQDALKILRNQRGGALDELVAVALRLSGLAKGASEEATDDFLSDPTNSSDSDSPEIWE